MCERLECDGHSLAVRDGDPNEVYALTAFLLYKNEVIKEEDVLDAQSLPWKHGTPRLQGYS